ncbi:MAG: hypothetical protein COX07_02765, partial [Bacteroidetes bacterium CG23_combo_of_CG06-09_8_20_14_all_32_9]
MKDDEDKLNKIFKEGSELTKQIEIEINKYVEENISNIQNIKRLSDYKILESQNIFNGIESEKQIVSKSFNELLEDYNKVKSVPENLEDIQSIDLIKIDYKILNEIKIDCKKEFSLSSLAEDFKKKIKEKQDFIESGMELLNNDSEKGKCPFCEQKLENNALALIDSYTKYLNDIEAKTIKQFKNNIEILEKYLIAFNNVENDNSKRINEFNSYKTKYIPSSKEIELNKLDTKTIKDEVELIVKSIKEKIKNISISIEITEE